MGRTYGDAERAVAIQRVRDNGGAVAPVARELGIPASTIRRWIDQGNARDWAATVAVHFGFVERFGFRLARSDASWVWVWRVVYRRERLDIMVDYERRDSWIDLTLARTTGSHGRRRDPFDHADIVDRVRGADLIRRRAEEPVRVLEPLRHEPDIETQLAFWAGALLAYGRDFLDGEPGLLQDNAPS